jgi:hypothetical protein
VGAVHGHLEEHAATHLAVNLARACAQDPRRSRRHDK